MVFTDGGCKQRQSIWFLRSLTFELSRHRRWDARPRRQKMYTVPVAGAWWPAVGARLERGVRPQFGANGNLRLALRSLYGPDGLRPCVGKLQSDVDLMNQKALCLENRMRLVCDESEAWCTCTLKPVGSFSSRRPVLVANCERLEGSFALIVRDWIIAE